MANKKGQITNPNGRPVGRTGIAKAMRAKWGEGLEKLVDYATESMLDPECPHATRKAWAEWIVERVEGKARMPIEVNGQITHAHVAINFSKLSDEELARLRSTLDTLLPESDQSIIDVPLLEASSEEDFDDEK